PQDKARTYPIAEAIPPEERAAEIEELARIQSLPFMRRFFGFLRLGGPGYMDAALTLGAGTLTAAMLSGAHFGYRTLWLLWVAMGLGAFMMAASARFTCRGGFGVITAQNRYHGWVVGSLLTGLLGTAAVAVIFNYGQYSLGTHMIESLTPLLGFEFPRQYNWVLYLALTSWLTLSYGRGRGTRLVETFMKGCIAIMMLAFGVCLVLVGVDWGAMLRGIFVPWLPSGAEGVDLFIASSSAAIGVMDWVFFQYAGLVRGWGREHETLARFDIVFGLVFPFLLVNYLVIAVFAGTLYGLPAPETGPDLARALVPLLGSTWSQVLFYLAFLTVPVTTTVGMSLAGAMAIHEAFGWSPDTSSWRWRVSVLLPQIGFLAVWYPRPVWLVIAIGAFLSLANNVVGWSFYLLLNDRRALGEDRSRSYLWNLGIMLQITLLNGVALLYVFNRAGWWLG
ncbi:MAG: NRAMP family divalent metal transporter, partial [Vicinamibacteria bacterium]